MSSMFFNGLTSVVELSRKLLILLLNFDVLLLKIGNFLVLDRSLVLETLVLDLNVTFDLGDVFLRLFLGVEFEIC